MDYSEDETYDDDMMSYDDGEAEEELPGEESPEAKKLNYKIIKDYEIRQAQEEDIALLSSTLSLTRVAACLILHRYKWNVEHAQDAWCTNEDDARKFVGMFNNPIVEITEKETDLVCGICFETYVCDARLKNTIGFCGHSFCGDCLTSYISMTINENGFQCLYLCCPDPSCTAAIGQDMVELLVSDSDKEKYRDYLVRSYIEEKKSTKWCPFPNCGSAVEFELGSDMYDVMCSCSRAFCFNCCEDAHHPVVCDTVAEWIRKNSSESENVTWLIANSKPCPKCKVPIEKNSGCSHMVCTVPSCRLQFCWLCLKPLSGHGACNGYSSEGFVDDARKTGKNYLMRYSHYYTRWTSNHKSMEKARADLHKAKTETLEEVKEKLGLKDIDFIVDAWLQIVECRRVLKWTYAYGYYLPEEETKKKQLFEFLQGQAETALERLHRCTEVELRVYLDRGANKDDFNREFRQKLVNLTSVTRTYFENLVLGMQNDFADDFMEVHSTTDAFVPESSSEMNLWWSCEVCTFMNEYYRARCKMCDDQIDD